MLNISAPATSIPTVFRSSRYILEGAQPPGRGLSLLYMSGASSRSSATGGDNTNGAVRQDKPSRTFRTLCWPFYHACVVQQNLSNSCVSVPGQFASRFHRNVYLESFLQVPAQGQAKVVRVSLPGVPIQDELKSQQSDRHRSQTAVSLHTYDRMVDEMLMQVAIVTSALSNCGSSLNVGYNSLMSLENVRDMLTHAYIFAFLTVQEVSLIAQRKMSGHPKQSWAFTGLRSRPSLMHQ